MIPETFTTPDGLKLHTRHWELDDSKAAVMLVHGLGEHLGRYEHVASALNAAGYAAAALDHRGHGRSEGQPRAFAPNVDTFVDDLEPLWKALEAVYKGKPLFVLGHSLGGLIATRFTLRHQDRMRGLVTSGVGLLPGASIPKAAISIGRVVGKAFPKLRLSRLDSALVSHDPAVVQAYDSDPLVFHGKVMAGFGLAMMLAGEDTFARANLLKLPVIIMHGESDRIVDPDASRQLYEKVSSSDKTLKIYDGLYHEIFNEPEQKTILADVIRWLDAHSS